MTPAAVSNIAHRAVAIKAGVLETIRSATLTNCATRSLGRLCAPVLLIALLAVALSVAPLAAQAPPDPESIATFAADCTTPQTDFNLGETVCAKLTGAPLGPPVQRAINWTGPFSFIVSSTNVVTDPQTELFTIPAPAASVVNGETVDNRGNWEVSGTTASDASVQARALFTVHDPAETVADLVVYSSISVADSDVSVGGNNTSGNLTSTLYVANRGPDTATSVTATELVPADTTFFSLTQDSGPAFTCTTPSVGGTGTITCTIASLAKGDVALFTVVYGITAATPDISLTANASSATTERDNSDNATTPIAPAPGGGGGGACTTSITCPANIAQNGDTTNEQGVFGALVTFNTPASSCGTVNCDPSSGSFFPVGTTDVTCSDDAGNSCSFTVTVNDTRSIVITLNGDNPMTVECHSSFTDPGATAKDGSGVSVPVTPSGTVNANVPGSYTITYTATSGSETATATRTVNVVDTTPPTITLLGADPMTVECHTSFTDPGATAADTCAGDLTSQIIVTGSVDVNTPGTDTLTYTVGDGEKNASITRTVNVVDTTPPTITCPANIVVMLPPNSTSTSMIVSYPAVTANDTCSGVTVTSNPVSGSVFPVGTTTVSAMASDASSNPSSCSFTVTVLYNFTGFFSPVDNPPVLNVMKAGKAIPVKFSLSGNKGLNIFAPGFPVSGAISCDASAPPSEVEELVTAGNSSLSYDPATDQYVYVWKTENAWAGTCRQLNVTLNDGTTHIANFKFR